MEIIVKVNCVDDVFKLNNADSYLLSNKNFSYRFDKSFTLTDIKKVKKHCIKKNKKLYVLINKIFKDKDLKSLEEYIIKLIDIGIDGIFFCDFAVFMIAKQYNFSSKCYFYHETFLRNTYDILTYQSYGISNIICSKDMNLEDINNLPKENKNSYGILCFGYFPLYESERKIISNFLKTNNMNLSISNSMHLFLKENTRNEKYHVLQQNGIASIFNDKPLSYLPYMKKLYENINMFIIDSLFFKTSYIYKVINLFKKSINEDNLEEKLATLNKKLQFTDGFLNKRIGLK